MRNSFLMRATSSNVRGRVLPPAPEVTVAKSGGRSRSCVTGLVRWAAAVKFSFPAVIHEVAVRSKAGQLDAQPPLNHRQIKAGPVIGVNFFHPFQGLKQQSAINLRGDQLDGLFTTSVYADNGNGLFPGGFDV